MPNAHAFGATNEPDTCLWCGAKLRTNYTMGDVAEGPRKLIKGDDYGVEDYTIPTLRYVNKEPTGKGWENNGYFCTLRCGEAFGLAFARAGYRMPSKGLTP